MLCGTSSTGGPASPGVVVAVLRCGGANIWRTTASQAVPATSVCCGKPWLLPQEEGVEEVMVREPFESIIGETFTDNPGTIMGRRDRALTKALGGVTEVNIWDSGAAVTAADSGDMEPEATGAGSFFYVVKPTGNAGDASSSCAPPAGADGSGRGLTAWMASHLHLVPASLARADWQSRGGAPHSAGS